LIIMALVNHLDHFTDDYNWRNNCFH
jgi:hypothetical protein